MRGDRMLAVLEGLGDVALGALDLFAVFTSVRYGATRGEMSAALRRREGERARSALRREREHREKQRYYNMLRHLKTQGLIREETGKDEKLFTLTAKGKTHISFLKAQQEKMLPDRAYTKEKSTRFTIVTFDIPEKERRKRDWLRAVLRNLGLTLIQKSVWVGKVKIPQRFLEDLYRLRLASCVEIFEISKAGSLEHLI